MQSNRRLKTLQLPAGENLNRTANDSPRSWRRETLWHCFYRLLKHLASDGDIHYHALEERLRQHLCAHHVIGVQGGIVKYEYMIKRCLVCLLFCVKSYGGTAGIEAVFFPNALQRYSVVKHVHQIGSCTCSAHLALGKHTCRIGIRYRQILNIKRLTENIHFCLSFYSR